MSEDQALPPDKLGDDREDRSFENLVYWQVRSCCFLGSQDRQNSGKVFVMDKDGMRREIVRIDWSDAFKNSVNILVALVRAKVRKDSADLMVPVETVQDAYQMFSTVLVYLAQHTTVLGYKYESEYIKFDKTKYKDADKEPDGKNN